MQTSSKPNPTQHLPRDEYGALYAAKVLSAEHQALLKEFLTKAIEEGLLPRPFVSYGKREFECLNHDVYDVRIARHRVQALVVQARTFWKDKRKGYTRSTKTYFLVERSGRKLTSRELESATCAKRAKNSTKLGQLVAHYSGGAVLPCPSPTVVVETAFKVLAEDVDGQLRSVYDDSTYELDKWRVEAVKADHGGGFYFYLDRDLALAAVQRNETFNQAWTQGKKLVLCEVEVSGRKVNYAGGKVAATRLRVLEVLQPIEAVSCPT